MSNENKMRVVLLQPFTAARIVWIKASLDGMQAVVGGDIQAIYPFEENAALICDEEGKLKGSALNRGLYDDSGQLLDILCGTVFICGCGDEHFTSLTMEQASRYAHRFRYPELFVQENGHIRAVPIRPGKDFSR